MTLEDILHALFYIAMFVLGFVLFFVCGDIANAQRDTPGVGGEALFLFLPAWACMIELAWRTHTGKW